MSKELKELQNEALTQGMSGKPFDEKSKGKSKRKFKFKKGKGKGGAKYSSAKLGSGKDFNDVAFYMKNPAIAESFGKLPFNYLVGNSIAGLNTPYAMSAVSSFGVDWMIEAQPNKKSDGVRIGLHNFISQVATIIYTKMRRANSGSTNGIEYVDPIISNLLASIDILVNSVYFSRTFKIANSFSWKNRMLPRTFFQHMGLDYDDFIANQANYRGRFQTLIAQAKTIRTLAGFPFIQAILAEFANIFKDSDTDTGREQLMLPVKYFHHIYDSTGTVKNPGGMVRILRQADLERKAGHNAIVYTGPKNPVSGVIDSSAFYKFSTWLDIMQVQIESLINDSDFNLLQADLEKAFGDSGYIVMEAMTNIDESLQPIYSGEFWAMFHNGTFANFDTDPDSGEDDDGRMIVYMSANRYANYVYQRHDSTSGEIFIDNYVALTQNNATDQSYSVSLIDTDIDNPTAADVLIMTRYKTYFDVIPKANHRTDQDPDFLPADLNANYFTVPRVASNFICFSGITTMLRFAGGGSMSVYHHKWNTGMVTSSAIPLVQYTHRPLVNSNNVNYENLLNDVNNIRHLSDDELLNLHRTAFLSLWNLPDQTNI